MNYWMRIVITLCCVIWNTSRATQTEEQPQYSFIQQAQHQIHLLEIDPALYKMVSVRADNLPTKRKTVSAFVADNRAIAGINGGFFYITPKGEARLAGALKINAEWLALPVKTRAAMGWNNNNKASILIDRIRTQSKRNEQGKLLVNVFPQLAASVEGRAAWQQFENIVGGTPLLIHNGEAVIDHSSEKTLLSFLEQRHARTAVCVKKDRRWLWLVASHTKEADRAYVTPIIEGLTIKELTDFLLDQNCEHAINLDGGGSSTLVFEDKIKNWPAGDCDELLHLYHERPVSDAILLMKR